MTEYHLFKGPDVHVHRGDVILRGTERKNVLNSEQASAERRGSRLLEVRSENVDGS